MQKDIFDSWVFAWLTLEELLGEKWREIIERREWRPQVPQIEKIIIASWGRCFRVIEWGKNN